MKTNLPLVTILTACIASLETAHAKIDQLATQKTTAESRIEILVRDGDADNAEQLTELSNLQAKREMLPSSIKRAEEARNEALSALVAELEQFERAIIVAGAEEREALLIHMEKVFVSRGWIKNPIEKGPAGDAFNRARAIASQFPIFHAIPFNRQMLFPETSVISMHKVEDKVSGALARSRALLAIWESRQTQGGFAPQAFAK